MTQLICCTELITTNNMKINPYLELSFQELELAYELFTYNEQWEAVRLVADAFCLKAELDIISLN